MQIIYREMERAIFLDRDGVINRERGDYTFEIADFQINEDVVAALRIFVDKGYLLIVVTNQSGIAKKIYDHKTVVDLHKHMERTLSEQGVSLSGIYYCPHHPDVTKCLCRKPESMMVEKAVARFNIDAAKSFMIGDRERDIIAGGTVGLKSILIESNSSLLDLVSMIP